MNKQDKDNKPSALVITIGGTPAKKHAHRSKVAKDKLKQRLVKMYDSWKPQTDEGKAYDAELKSVIDSFKH